MRIVVNVRVVVKYAHCGECMGCGENVGCGDENMRCDGDSTGSGMVVNVLNICKKLIKR